MIIEYKEKTYKIPDYIWEIHCKLHPIRSEDALRDMIRIRLDENAVTPDQIIRMIKEDYSMHEKLPEIIEKARKRYKMMKHQ